MQLTASSIYISRGKLVKGLSTSKVNLNLKKTLYYSYHPDLLPIQWFFLWSNKWGQPWGPHLLPSQLIVLWEIMKTMAGKLSLGFHEDITKLVDIFKENLFPAHLIKGLSIITLLGPKVIIVPGVPFPSLHQQLALSYIGHFLLLLKKRFTILSRAIAMIQISNQFFLLLISVSHLV